MKLVRLAQDLVDTNVHLPKGTIGEVVTLIAAAVDVKFELPNGEEVIWTLHVSEVVFLDAEEN